MADNSFYKRIRLLGWIITDICVIVFIVLMGISLLYGLGINGIPVLKTISIPLFGVAIIFIVGLIIEIYGSIGVRRSSSDLTQDAALRLRTERY